MTWIFITSLPIMVACDVLSSVAPCIITIFLCTEDERQLISTVAFNYNLGKSAFHVLCSKGADHSKTARKTYIKHATCNTPCSGSEPSKQRADELI